MIRRLVVVLVILGSVGAWSHAPTTHAAAPMQQDQRCFAETNQCIEGRFHEFWQQNGGLAVFGFPITGEVSETTPDGTFTVQYFERNRFELHPDLPPPYDVSLGRLGDLVLQQQERNWWTFPKGQQTPECLWFEETGHAVCEPFRQFWEGQGLQDPVITPYARSLALFGQPLSEPSMETNAAGDTVLTQWFERARIELHPDLPEPYRIQIGLLGSEFRSGTPPATSTPTPEECTDIPELLNAEVRPSNCVFEGTRISFDIYGFRPNEVVEYWIVTPDGSRDPEQTFYIGVSGAVDDLDFNTTGLSEGVWTWYFRGRGSDHFSIIPFRVIARR